MSLTYNPLSNGPDQNENTISTKSPRRRQIKRDAFHSITGSVAELNPEDVAHFASKDRRRDKTFARVIVEEVFINNKWYNPNKGNGSLDLKKGWAFYEHYTLARRKTETNGARQQLQRSSAISRETQTSLFTFFGTPASVIHEWGLGISLYFNAIKFMTITLFIAGLISIPNIAYFSSEEYHGVGYEPSTRLLWGSAVCNITKWVTCEPSQENHTGWCNLEKMKEAKIEYAVSADHDHTFVEKSLCYGGTFSNGMFNYAAILFILLVTILYAYYTRKISEQLDECLLTASDYSIHIKNPHKEATDPSEWRNFFMKYAEKNVVACTIIIDNSDLILTLIKRRAFFSKLQNLLAPYVDVDINDEEGQRLAVENHIEERDKTRISFLSILYSRTFQPIFSCTFIPILQCFNLLLTAEKLVAKIKMCTKDAIKLKKKYDVVDVIVTFETEISQRNCLKDLRTGKVEKTEEMNKLFQGGVPCVDRPVEPCALRYGDMSRPRSFQTIRRIVTMFIMCGLVLLGAWITRRTRLVHGPYWGGIVTSLLNLIIPQIVYPLLLIERHSAEGNSQKSLYTKIIIFRWFNTVILLKFLNDYNRTLSDGNHDLLKSVSGIFVSEIIFTPIICLLDIGGTLSKHYFAPRAKTQQQMYLCFKGTPYNLAEKYTDLTRIMLLSYFYSALFPAAFFFGSLTLFIRYYVDKYCLIVSLRHVHYEAMSKIC